MKTNYTIILHPEAMQNVETYCSDLALQGLNIAGCRFRNIVRDVTNIDETVVLSGLLNSKIPMIFAESQVVGDGSDWTSRELSLLGDVGIAAKVNVFDDGRHASPDVHREAFDGLLLFMPGPLLRNDQGGIPADWETVVRNDNIDHTAYDRLIEKRMLPLLLHSNEEAGRAGRRAFVTVPGIGCGQFAGKFRGQMGEHLKRALKNLLLKSAEALPNVAALYLDPYSECSNERHQIGGVSFLVRPLLDGNHGKPQLCRPEAYQEDGDDFANCLLTSFVAWDHVSWPGNDYFGGNRTTDDGVKAAATSSMFALTGIRGIYDPEFCSYQPPAGFSSWEQVVDGLCLKIESKGRTKVYGIA